MKLTTDDGSVIEGTPQEFAEMQALQDGDNAENETSGYGETRDSSASDIKIGDQVRVIGKRGYHAFAQGTMGTVEATNVRNEGISFDVEDEKGLCQEIDSGDLEKVDNESLADYVSAFLKLLDSTDADGDVSDGNDDDEFISFAGGAGLEVVKKHDDLPDEGDKIRITGNNNNNGVRYHMFDIGEIATVITPAHSLYHHDRVYAEGERNGKWFVHVNDFELVGKDEDEKLSREDIVDIAKKDVETIERDIYGEDKPLKYGEYGTPGHCTVAFTVNIDSQYAIAEIDGRYSSIAKRKGIGKVVGDEAFNKHIAKAIALRDALDLDIPEKYTQALEPEGVEVGDIFRITGEGPVPIDGETGKITEMKTSLDALGHGTAFLHTHDSGWLGENQVKIIDDSNR